MKFASGLLRGLTSAVAQRYLDAGKELEDTGVDVELVLDAGEVFALATYEVDHDDLRTGAPRTGMRYEVFALGEDGVISDVGERVVRRIVGLSVA